MEHKRFCRHQYVGFPPEKDCMDDYIKEKKNAKLQKEKEGSLWTQQKVSLQNKEEKEKVLTDKTTAIKKLEELRQFLNKKKQASFQK